MLLIIISVKGALVTLFNMQACFLILKCFLCLFFLSLISVVCLCVWVVMLNQILATVEGFLKSVSYIQKGFCNWKGISVNPPSFSVIVSSEGAFLSHLSSSLIVGTKCTFPVSCTCPNWIINNHHFTASHVVPSRDFPDFLLIKWIS